MEPLAPKSWLILRCALHVAKASNVAASVTANVPLTVVADPDVDNVGVCVAQVTTSVKLAFICDATMFVPATNELVTAKAPLYRNLRVLYMPITDVMPHLPRVDGAGET